MASHVARAPSTRLPWGADQCRGAVLETQVPESLLREELHIAVTAPAKARSLLARVAGAICPDMLADAQLLVSEVVSERVRASRSRQEHPLVLHVILTNQHLRIEVGDPHGQRPILSSPAAERVPRLELQLVAQLADRWGMSAPPGVAIWFELDR